MICGSCKEDLPRHKFQRVWTGKKTGKALEECSERTQELYHRRDNCQLYCKECDRKWDLSNIDKCRSYYRKYRDGNKGKIRERRRAAALSKRNKEGGIYEGTGSSGYEVSEFQNAI